MLWNPAPYIAIADALALLFKPQVEAVLHDVVQDRILHIAGAFSRRRTGDPSLTELEELRPFSTGVIGPYAKANFDGRELKSISVLIRDDTEGRPVGMLCINLDVSAFGAAQQVLQQLMLAPAASSVPVQTIFASDWREQINASIASFLDRRNSSLSGLTVSDVVDLVRDLDQRGFFKIRKAADHIAAALSISRATLYKRLAAARQANQSEVA